MNSNSKTNSARITAIFKELKTCSLQKMPQLLGELERRTEKLKKSKAPIVRGAGGARLCREIDFESVGVGIMENLEKATHKQILQIISIFAEKYSIHFPYVDDGLFVLNYPSSLENYFGKQIIKNREIIPLIKKAYLIQEIVGDPIEKLKSDLEDAEEKIKAFKTETILYRNLQDSHDILNKKYLNLEKEYADAMQKASILIHNQIDGIKRLRDASSAEVVALELNETIGELLEELAPYRRKRETDRKRQANIRAAKADAKQNPPLHP